MQLFDEVARFDPSPASLVESRFEFLNRVSAPYWATVRSELEGWFARFPANEKKDIRERFRERDRGQSIGAFWELYLHELFSRLGYSLTHHPCVEGVAATPDFLVSRQDGASFYLEAAVVNESKEEESAANRRDRIVELLNRTTSLDFVLWLEALHEGQTDPPVGPLRRELSLWLSNLNADALPTSPDMQTFDQLPRFRWKKDGWRLVFVAIPKTPAARGRQPDRVIASWGPAEGRNVDDHLFIRAKLIDKAKKYGVLDRPYVIAILSTRTTTKFHEFARALYSVAWEHPDLLLQEKGLLSSLWKGHRSGFWLTSSGPARSGVSAVLAATHLDPWSVCRAAPELWINPWPRFPLLTPLPFRTIGVNMTTGKLDETAATMDPWEIFGLSEEWPPGEPFPN